MKENLVKILENKGYDITDEVIDRAVTLGEKLKLEPIEIAHLAILDIDCPTGLLEKLITKMNRIDELENQYVTNVAELVNMQNKFNTAKEILIKLPYVLCNQ